MTKASNTVDSPWAWRGETLEIRLYIQPGAKATELSGLHDGRLKVRLKAAPVEGKANQALIAYLSDQFKVPQVVGIYKNRQEQSSKNPVGGKTTVPAITIFDLLSQMPMVP